MPTIHKECPHILVLCPRAVVQAIVQNQKSSWIYTGTTVLCRLVVLSFYHVLPSLHNVVYDRICTRRE